MRSLVRLGKPSSAWKQSAKAKSLFFLLLKSSHVSASLLFYFVTLTMSTMPSPIWNALFLPPLISSSGLIACSAIVITSLLLSLLKALQLSSSVSQDVSAHLWSCNFNSQLANAFIIQADFPSSLSALESGFLSASHICFPELQMFFTASMLHVHIMQWTDDYSVEKAVQRCDDIWQTISSDKNERCLGLFFYNEMLHVFYRLRLCDYKNAQHHVDRLDQAMNAHTHRMQETQQLLDELGSLNLSLSRYDLPSRERSALSARQSQLQDRVNALYPSSTDGNCVLYM